MLSFLISTLFPHLFPRFGFGTPYLKAADTVAVLAVPPGPVENT